MHMTDHLDDIGEPAPRSPRRGISLPALLIGLAAAVVLASPWLLAGLGIARLPLLAGVVAWRGSLTAGSWLAVAFLVVTMIFRSRRRVAAGLLIPALLLASVGTGTLLAPRLSSHHPETAARKLTVLSWNINGSLVDATTVAQETTRHHPEVLVLPSISDMEFSRLEQLLGPDGYTSVRTPGSETAVFSTVGYQAAPSQDYGTNPAREAVAEGSATGLPRIIAVHLAIPLLGGGTSAWNREVDWLGGFCRAAAPTVIVGDFNAAVDNFVGTDLAHCADAATAVGEQYSGTWPTALPPALASPIDHLLVAGAGMAATGFTVLRDQDASGARHRPILATVAVPPAP